MATNGKSSCEFYVFVLICSFVGYELPKVFMIGGAWSIYGFPCGWAMCGVVLMVGFSLLDINQGWMELEV